MNRRAFIASFVGGLAMFRSLPALVEGVAQLGEASFKMTTTIGEHVSVRIIRGFQGAQRLDLRLDVIYGFTWGPEWRGRVVMG